MVLIVTHTEDYSVDYVATILNNQGLPFLRLNTDQLNSIPYEFRFDIVDGISVKGVSAFSGLWFRRVRMPVISDYTAPVNRFVTQDYESLLFNLVTTVQANNLVSDPYQIYKAENKMYQLRVARSVGLSVPPTLVTNSVEGVKEFASQRNTIIKPIRSGKVNLEKETRLVYTNLLRQEDVEQRDLTPCIIQKSIGKQYELRVTVVHRCVFAAKVESQGDPDTKMDWRRKQLKFEPYELPGEISDKCIQLVDRLGLQFGAIDLIRSTDGSYYFLEINPNGQWVWIELDTGLKISDALIKYLYHGE